MAVPSAGRSSPLEEEGRGTPAADKSVLPCRPPSLPWEEAGPSSHVLVLHLELQASYFPLRREKAALLVSSAGREASS